MADIQISGLTAVTSLASGDVFALDQAIGNLSKKITLANLSSSLLAAGSDTQIQFNNAGVFGASSTFVFDGTKLGLNNSTPKTNLHVGPFASYTWGTETGVWVADNTKNSGFSLGQGNSNVGRMLWIYDATPANAYFYIGTYGNSNPIEMNASVLGLQTTSGNGVVIGSSSITANTQFEIITNAATSIGQRIELANAQTANAFEINSFGGSGGDLVNVTKDGWLGIGGTPTELLHVISAGAWDTANIKVESTNTAAGARFSAVNDAGKGAYFNVYGSLFSLTELRNMAGFGADDGIRIFSDATLSSGGTNDIEFSAGGYANINFIVKSTGLIGFNETTPTAQTHTTVGLATTVGQKIDLANAQTANAFEINSFGGSGGDLVRVDSSGVLTNARTIQITGVSSPADGTGLELLYSGGIGIIQAYDRDLAAYKPIQIVGSTINLSGATTFSQATTLANSTTIGGFRFISTDASNTLWKSDAGAFAITSSGGDMYLGAGTTQKHISILNATGNVGIGETTPTAKADITGSTTSAASLRLRDGTAPTSPNNGDIWNDSTQQSLQTYIAGLEQSIRTTVYTQTADKTVANTVTETSVIGTGIGTVTMPANFLVAGKMLKFHIHGYHSSTGNPNLTLRIKLGGTTVASVTVVSGNGTNDGFEIIGEITCRTDGATGTVTAGGTYEELQNSGASEGLVKTTTTTIDTTGTLAFDVTAEWGTAAAGNTITSQNFNLDIKN